MAKTIVLIDDDQDDLDLMREAIVEINPSFALLPFTQPEEAINALTNDLVLLPDYIFIDINMPKITGDYCLKTLRKVEEFKNTPIIMYSTSLPVSVSERLKALGATFSFQKPYKIEHYVQILSPILSA